MKNMSGCSNYKVFRRAVGRCQFLDYLGLIVLVGEPSFQPDGNQLIIFYRGINISSGSECVGPVKKSAKNTEFGNFLNGPKVAVRETFRPKCLGKVVFLDSYNPNLVKSQQKIFKKNRKKSFS